jgi:hypothetical protein
MQPLAPGQTQGPGGERQRSTTTASPRYRSDSHGAKQAVEAAVRVDGDSPGGRDALKRLRSE